MPLRAKIILVLLSFFLLLFVLNLIRKRKLKIEHSILWLMVSVILLIGTIWHQFADRVALLMGIDYPPALFLAISVFFFLIILMHFSIELSKLKDQNKNLSQELAIYKGLIDELTSRANHDS